MKYIIERKRQYYHGYCVTCNVVCNNNCGRVCLIDCMMNGEGSVNEPDGSTMGKRI